MFYTSICTHTRAFCIHAHHVQLIYIYTSRACTDFIALQGPDEGYYRKASTYIEYIYSNRICVSLLRMMNTTNDKAFVEVVAHILKEEPPPNSTILRAAVRKTSTMDRSRADLATAVD